MVKNKTTETNASVEAFLSNVDDATKRNDSFRIAEIFKNVTGFEPKMWSSGIIGFGRYHYKSKSGREGDWLLTGFSPRKDAIALYFASAFKTKDQLLEKLGNHKTGVGCVYIKKLADIDTKILEKIIIDSVEELRRLNPE